MSSIFSKKDIPLIAHALRNGEVCAIPTETVYGLAASITHPEGIKKIFTLKNRPATHPLIIHIHTLDQLSEWAFDIPEYVYQLAKQFWPGPLTFVLKKTAAVSSLVTGGQSNVAIRMPAHPLALSLIKAVGCPLAAPSANRFGQVSPTCAQHVLSEFQGTVQVLEGGPSQIGIESTIIDARLPHLLTILRPGMITEKQIASCLQNKIAITSPHLKSPQLPGSLPYHYAPNKPTMLFHSNTTLAALKRRYGHALFLITLSQVYTYTLGYKMPSQPEHYAQKLYDVLRTADQSQAQAIAIESPPNDAEWQGIQDRLKKASARDSIESV